MRSPSISQALPTVPTNALGELLDGLDLSPDAPLAELLSLGAAASGALTLVAEIITENTPHRPLRQILPGLRRVSNEPLPFQALTARPANGLRRGGLSTWGDLSLRTPAELLALPALGRKSVADIIALALHRAGVELLRGDRGDSTDAAALTLQSDAAAMSVAESSETDARTDTSSEELPGLDTLARWAISIGGAATVGEALDLATSGVLPADVKAALGALRDTPLEVVAPAGSNLAAAYERLWAQCGDERRQKILRRRVIFEAPTLDELGEELSLTRERVRQLQKQAEENLESALDEPACAEIRWRVAELRGRLGTAIPWPGDAAQRALASATRGLPEGERVTAEALFLWLAGPFRLDRQAGWIFAEPDYLLANVGPRSAIGPPPQASLVEAITSDEGMVDLEEAQRRAAAAGLTPAAIEAWVATCPFREINGTLVRWRGNVADKAEVLLARLNRPATADELNDIIGEGHSVRGLRNRLLDEERFVRTDRHRFGLRRWGLEEYTGIVDEIEEEIQRRGEDADLDDLVRTITQQFGLRIGSVISYTSVPKFVIENGRIRLRRADEPYIPTRTLFDETGAYLVDENRCSYRLRVDRDVLRGSGRSLPQGVGAWLGVFPGSRRQFHFPDGDLLLVSWPESALLGPSLGSLRRQAIALAAEDGDYLLLVFDRANDEVQPVVVRQVDLDAAAGWRRGALLIGLQAKDEDQFDRALTTSLGASSAAEVRRRCRDRGEQELAELVRVETSLELDDALMRLKDVL